MSDTKQTAIHVHGDQVTEGPSRRQAMQWVLGALAAGGVAGSAFAAPGKTGAASRPSDRTEPHQEGAATQTGWQSGKGYGTDPKLTKTWKPGDAWPLTFDATQTKAATALADTIIPADKWGPAASKVGVVPMIDEWISSPYPQTQADHPVVIEGLAWIDAESGKRFDGKTFADLSDDQKHAICDDICWHKTAKPEFQKAAHFFSRFRSITASAYYATQPGWHAIGYVGNTMLRTFDGPPPEVLEKLGVTQTVE